MSKHKVLKSGILGVIVGSVVGLLFAPKSGKETREDIKNTAIKAGSEVEKQLKEVHMQLSARIVELSERAQDAKGKAKTELSELSEKAEMVKGKVGETISALREGESDDDAVQKALKDGKDTLEKIAKKTSKK